MNKTMQQNGPLRVGVGGPVGSGKTSLVDALCKRLRDHYDIAAITNDIYTKWDAEYLVRSGALPAERSTDGQEAWSIGSESLFFPTIPRTSPRPPGYPDRDRSSGTRARVVLAPASRRKSRSHRDHWPEVWSQLRSCF